MTLAGLGAGRADWKVFIKVDSYYLYLYFSIYKNKKKLFIPAGTGAVSSYKLLFVTNIEYCFSNRGDMCCIYPQSLTLLIPWTFKDIRFSAIKYFCGYLSIGGLVSVSSEGDSGRCGCSPGSRLHPGELYSCHRQWRGERHGLCTCSKGCRAGGWRCPPLIPWTRPGQFVLPPGGLPRTPSRWIPCPPGWWTLLGWNWFWNRCWSRRLPGTVLRVGWLPPVVLPVTCPPGFCTGWPLWDQPTPARLSALDTVWVWMNLSFFR